MDFSEQTKTLPTVHDKTYIAEETNRLLKEGIIEPSISPWRAQVLVVPETDTHRKRMVIDYSRTINTYTELDAYPLPNIEETVNEISSHSIFSTLDLKIAYHQIPLREDEKKYTAFESGGRLYQFTRMPYGVTNGVSSFQRTIDNIIQKEHIQSTYTYVDNVTVCGKTKSEHDDNLQKFLNASEKYGITFNHDKSILSSESIKLLGYEVQHNSVKPDPDRLKPLLELPAPIDAAAQRRVVGMFAYYSRWIKNFSNKIRPLVKNIVFPIPEDVMSAFETLKTDLQDASLTAIDPTQPLIVETDASKFAIGATLTQNGRPVAFFSRTLKPHEVKLHPVEKEAFAIVESLRKWRHFLIGVHFKLMTDQRSVSFMFDHNGKGKIKNEKIGRWRMELSDFKFDILYRPGRYNVAADAFSRINSCSAIIYSQSQLAEIHTALCHPGITRLLHFVKSRNLPYSVEDVKKVIENCKVCMELKPKFQKSSGTLIKATQPFQQLNIDFKGPLPTSASGNKYMLTLVDEYSRFPFAFPCRNMESRTVIKCFNQLFAIFGMPGFIHNDRAPDFLSDEVKQYLHSKGIATSKTSRYNPRGNGQCERYNGIIWKSITLGLKSSNLPLSAWEQVLPDALHSIRSLLCTSTNTTPHERLFNFTRRSTAGNSFPSWLSSPGPVYVKKHVRQSKYDPLVEEAELIEANPEYAYVRLKSGTETTVSVRDLAPCPREEERASIVDISEDPTAVREDNEEPAQSPEPVVELRRSSRDRRLPDRFADSRLYSI